jgi:hypothetical protein
MITMRMWQNLILSSERYLDIGYGDLPQPWIASREAIYCTLPKEVEPCIYNGKILIGSAEQAFIDCIIEGTMRPGSWQAITPCFRDEPIDDLHKPYFMKLELIHYLPEHPEARLQIMLREARQVMSHILTPSDPPIEIQKTEAGFDLTLRGIEIGSYGIRSHVGHQWVYGTGIAEPRFTQALSAI